MNLPMLDGVICWNRGNMLGGASSLGTGLAWRRGELAILAMDQDGDMGGLPGKEGKGREEAAAWRSNKELNGSSGA